MASIINEDYLLVETSNLTQSERDIHHAINRQISLLYGRKWEILDEITGWGKKNIADIEQHVEQQKEIVEKQYAIKINELNTMRSHMLKQVVGLEEKQDTEQIQQLIRQCQNLKEELVKVTNPVFPLSKILVSTNAEISESEEQQRQHESTPENTVPDSISIENSSSDELNQLHEFASNDLPPPTPATPNVESFVQFDDNRSSMENPIIDKCPLCLMIFSPNMNINQRGVHINEHYND